MTPRRPRVVFITITFDPEPGAQRGLPLARQLAARGWEVKVLTAFPQYPAGRYYPGYRLRLWQWETMDGIRVLRVPIYPSHDTRALRRIWTYVSFMLAGCLVGVPLIGPADVVYLYEPPPTNGLISVLLKWVRGAPIVHAIADMWPETVLSSGMVPARGVVHTVLESLIGAWCRLMYRQASVLTPLSPGFKRLLMERGVPGDRIEVSYNWADEDTLGPVPRDPALAAELGLEGRFNIVYAGNMGPLQGLETVVRAAALARDRAPNMQLVMIGTGPHESAVKALAAELGADNVRFIARRDYREMSRIYALSDVVLVHLRDFPFLAATIPSKTQVGLLCGRPLLLAVAGDAADLVREAGAGLIVPPENPAELAEAMVAFDRMPVAERESLGAQGRRYYMKHLSLDHAGARHHEIFSSLLSRSRSGRALAGSAGPLGETRGASLAPGHGA